MTCAAASHPYLRRRLFAFTLIEMIVAVAIVTLLAALVFAAVNPSVQKSKTTRCASNLRNLASALLMYASDYDSRLPPFAATELREDQFMDYSHTWQRLLQPYLKSRHLACPSVEVIDFLKPYPDEPESWGYAYNHYLTSITKIGPRIAYTSGVHEGEVELPSDIICFFDARPGITSHRGPDIGRTTKQIYGFHMYMKAEEIVALTPGALRHSRGANYAYIDGHVKWLRPSFFEVLPQEGTK